MRSFWSEPFLWIHLAGLAAIPILLGLCLLGLAVGEPREPVWQELLLIAVVGVAPVLWMQFFRPFNIFSILIVAIKPDRLTIEQRKILSLFKTPLEQLLAVLAPFFLVAILRQIYLGASIAAPVAPFPPEWRLAGVLLAAVGFLFSNLFLQVPVSVLRVLITSESAFAATEPYPLEKIAQDFTTPGWQVNQILPLISVQPKHSSPASEPIIEDTASNSSNKI